VRPPANPDLGSGATALSVVIAVLNEEENVPELYERLIKTLGGLDSSYEVIFVDDGSTDGTFRFLRELSERDPHVRAVRFSRNFGQHVALSAGIERSRGEAVILMDADLQNDPQDIPRLVAKLREGHDVVSGWRTDRREVGIARRVGSLVIGWLISVSTGAVLHDHNCGFKALSRRVARDISRYGHLRRFLPLLLVTLARSVGEVPVADHPRRHGRSKYHFAQLLALTLEFLIAFSTRPFRIVGCAGILGVLAGLTAASAYLAGRFVFGMPASDRILAAVVLVTFTGFQFMILGLLGEYVVRAYHAAQALPLYVVEEEIGTAR
jgi:glycosyltransferase involved in cell wall biosynthesis